MRKRADMVLLTANPLHDIRNSLKIDGVVLGGRWLDQTERAAMIERAVRAINGRAP